MSSSDPLKDSGWRMAPLVIGHRGACRAAPENTLASFRLAAQMGADAIELDAKLTADGETVVHHDLTLDRTTTGTGRLSQHRLDQLKALDAGLKFGSGFAGERIPTLAEVFEAVGRQVLINVELTNYERPGDHLPDAVVRLVREHHLEPKVLFSSFNVLALRRAARLAPEIPRALLVEKGEPGWLRALFGWLARYEAYHPQDVLASQALIRRQLARGRRVNVWTVNDPERMRQLISLGVHGIITDIPDVARQALSGAIARG